MKTNALSVSPWCWHGVALAGVLFALASASSSAQPNPPVITDVRLDGSNVVVTATVPDGMRRVTLECRERVGPGGWAPRAVQRIDSSAGSVTFRLPRSRALELIRIRADASETLPATFYSGATNFSDAQSSDSLLNRYATVDATTGTPKATREVVESDIWKTRGQTLYFFNQLRGLQVIDVADPDAAEVSGTLDLPAVGEDMYLLGSKHVVLLARQGCNYGESEVIIAADNSGSPAIVARVPVTGYIQESRMVGTALYVASQSYRPAAGTTNGVWEWGLQVTSFDVADPELPVARGELWYSGYGNVVAATDRLLFVVTQDPSDGWRSIVRCIDITAPDGTMHAYESIRVAGRVTDKFKLNWDGATFTSIAEDWSGASGRTLVTRLETFRLPDPRSMGPMGVVKLGQLELGAGERLHATRFDGDRVYVVTFFQIDPLWVVDLSNAAAPRIAGSVDVPGWSTFIQPLGNRLVTIGVETNRVAVSLFDVANPAAPALLSRVPLGDGYSWSEANWDEQAFGVLPEADLILVPFAGYTTNGYASQVQLIDLNADSLVARGIIEHAFQPRRATVYADRILSLSGWELLTVDATDRDHPEVRNTLALAWPVDRVFLHGDFLVAIGGAGGISWWDQSGSPVLRVAAANAPNTILSELALENLPVVGASVRDGRLYLAQGEQGGYWYWPVVLAEDGTTVVDPPRTKFLLTVIGLDALPALSVIGQVTTNIAVSGWGAEYEAVWPRPDVLVWAGRGYGYWLCDFVGPMRMGVPSLWWWPWRGGGNGQLIAFDVSDAAAPQLASEVNLTTTNWASFSSAFTAEGRVYLSHQASTFEPVPADNTTSGTSSGRWVYRSYLNVVDYADPRDPLLRQPVNIPGQLNGISHQGEVLYTVGTHWTTNAAEAWVEYLDASAYDGVAAHLIDSLRLSNSWPRPLLVVETNIILGRADNSGSAITGVVTVGGEAANESGGANALETWVLAAAGRFVNAGSVELAMPASTLVNWGALVAAQQTDNTITLFDATDGAALRQVGSGQPSGCQWFDLSRADGALGRGLWIPLSAYGIGVVPVD